MVIDDGAALTVVRAPFGFGKTTLVADWANSREEDRGVIVWVDATHSTPGTFWAGVAAAFTEGGIELDASADSPFTAVLDALRGRSSELTLVIDGFDAVAERQIQDDLHELLLGRRRLRIILCARRDDVFDEVLWSDLTVSAIGPRDLIFTLDETTSLARTLGVELDADAACSLQDAGGGLPGLTRALALELSRTGRSVGGIEPIVEKVSRDYLRRRALKKLATDEELSVGFATAVAETVTADLARALTGDERAGSLLKQLESEGMLAASTDTETGAGSPDYRWPTAVRAALRAELDRRSPGATKALNSRAASWYLAKRSYAEAIRFAMAADDVPLVMEIMELGWPRLLTHHLRELDPVFAAIPLEVVAAHPQAAALRDIRLFLAGQADDFLLSLPDPLPKESRKLTLLAESDRALEALQTATALSIALRIRGRALQAARYGDVVELLGREGRFHRPDLVTSFVPNAFLQVGIARGFADDVAGGIRILRDAFALAPDSESGHVAVDSAGKLALLHALRGETDQAMLWLERHDRPYQKSEWMERWVSLGGGIARVLIAVDRLDPIGAADAIAELRLTPREEQNWSPFVVYARARYALQWGDRIGALARVREELMNRRSWLREGSTMLPLLTALESELLIALGKANQADQLLASAPNHRAFDAPRARFALLSGRPERALRIATAGLARAGSHPAQTELLLIAASAEHRQGNAALAVASLRRALDSAHATGSLRPLSTAPSDQRAGLMDQLADRPDTLNPVQIAPDPFPSGLRVIDLTDRETLILERIEQGMSVAAVAEDLYVSPNTIKTQLRSLYQKLDVTSRDEAIARANEHDLLVAPTRPAQAGSPTQTTSTSFQNASR